MKNYIVYSLVLAAMTGIPRVSNGDDGPGEQVAARMDTTVHVELNYLLYLPKDYANQKTWPLLLFLHGSGEKGDNLELVKKHGPPKRIAAGDDFPFIVVSPQCPENRRWEPIELVALLDELGQAYKVDTDRVYVTGLSMGGFGTWRLAAYAPDRIAAIAPICGGGETYWVEQFAHLPVWAFHGAKDTSVPLKRSLDMVAELREQGGDPKLTVYPDADHDCWTETYNNPEFYEWLLAQRRGMLAPPESTAEQNSR